MLPLWLLGPWKNKMKTVSEGLRAFRRLNSTGALPVIRHPAGPVEIPVEDDEMTVTTVTGGGRRLHSKSGAYLLWRAACDCDYISVMMKRYTCTSHCLHLCRGKVSPNHFDHVSN